MIENILQNNGNEVEVSKEMSKKSKTTTSSSSTKEEIVKRSKDKLVQALALDTKKIQKENSLSSPRKRSKSQKSSSKKKRESSLSSTLMKKEKKDKKLDIIGVIESGEMLDSFDLTSKTIRGEVEDPPMVYAYAYEASIHSTNEDSRSAIFTLPNTVQDDLLIPKKDSISSKILI